MGVANEIGIQPILCMQLAVQAHCAGLHAVRLRWLLEVGPMPGEGAGKSFITVTWLLLVGELPPLSWHWTPPQQAM